jgi:hypothetical protein
MINKTVNTKNRSIPCHSLHPAIYAVPVFRPTKTIVICKPSVSWIFWSYGHSIRNVPMHACRRDAHPPRVLPPVCKPRLPWLSRKRIKPMSPRALTPNCAWRMRTVSPALMWNPTVPPVSINCPMPTMVSLMMSIPYAHKSEQTWSLCSWWNPIHVVVPDTTFLNPPQATCLVSCRGIVLLARIVLVTKLDTCSDAIMIEEIQARVRIPMPIMDFGVKRVRFGISWRWSVGRGNVMPVLTRRVRVSPRFRDLRIRHGV